MPFDAKDAIPSLWDVLSKPSPTGTWSLGSSSLGWLALYMKGVTVANLPSAATAGVGARQFVTDATATTFASVVAGTGGNPVPVYSDGTNWRIG